MITVREAIVLVAASVLLHGTAAADGIIDKRFQLTVAPQFGVFRGQAPLPLSVTLNWSGDELMEGRLRLKWYVDQTLLGDYVTPETALVNSSMSRTVLLPPVIMPHDEAICSVQAEFVTKSRVYDLDIHDLVVPLDWRRTFVVGICRSPKLRMDVNDSSGGARLVQSLRLEPFFDNDFHGRELRTMVVEVEPEKLPTSPLPLLGFDVLIVPGESFGELTNRCLEAMETWVEAGGSLGVLIDGRLPESHVEFLNRLSGRNPGEPPYRRSNDGEVTSAAGDDDAKIDLFRTEFGRLVVVRGHVDYGSDEWQQAMLFLWKVRPQHVDGWTDGKPLPLVTETSRDNVMQLLTLEPLRAMSSESLTTLLLPESIQGLPLLTVSAILIVFLIAIGPGDYLLLGWLRRRRWTWALFPLMSLVFTGLTMWLAQRHLGVENLGRSITIVDVGSNGRPVRTSRFELLFTASSHVDVSEQDQSLMVPIDPPTADTRASRIGLGFAPKYDPPWTYEGSLPNHYVARRAVDQWSPRLARTTVLGETELVPNDAVAEVHWDSVTWEKLAEPAAVDRLRREIQSHDPQARVLVVGKEPAALTQAANSMSSTILELVTQFSESGASSLFSIVSQVSPTSAGNWEDLAVLDSSDQQRLVLVMTEPREGQYVIFRRLVNKAD